jgi:hypothetical protein
VSSAISIFGFGVIIFLIVLLITVYFLGLNDFLASATCFKEGSF